MDQKFLFFVIVFSIISITATILIFFAKGYKIDLVNKTLEQTGMIAVISNPQGASIYLNNHLISATNYTISNLSPGEYVVKVVKEGYASWEKRVEVKPQVVTPLEITLFPAVPELRPLTYTGVGDPKISFDGTKVAYKVKNGEKSGLWVLDLADKPLIFSRDPKQIARDTKTLAFSESTFEWAPDNKTILSTLQEEGKKEEAFTRNYLLNIDQLNNDRLYDVTPTIESTKRNWEEDRELKNKDRLSRVNEEGISLAEGCDIKWSPDETKFIAVNEEKRTIFDTKNNKSYSLPAANNYTWFPDSKHIILVKQDVISIIESDGTNEMVIYNGNFDQQVVFPWPNGSKLIIAANFNTTASLNLYTINLKP